MEHKVSQHIIQGMKRDISPSKANNNYAYENRNIRITADNDNNLLSITNEKGTTILSFNEIISGDEKNSSSFDSNIIGHCVLNEYLILFIVTGGVITSDRIIRFNFNTKEFFIIFDGNLNFNKDYPIEAFSLYENEKVQKVYWTDGLNCPRVINIVGHDGVITDNTAFNFIPSLALNEEVTVLREETGGSFSPGTIQYAFSYYNKYGSESNIFYTTELNYISHDQRGGSVGDNVSNSFKINITGVETKFDYLRIYSIHRAESNNIPNVKILTDINLKSNSQEINYIDTGNTGESIDPTLLLYIGGKEIVANTMTHKDNTLFLGNITLKDEVITLDSSLIEKIANTVSTEYRNINIDIGDFNSYYYYDNQLKYGNTSTFKVGEYYRIGLQFQSNTGEWSQPIFIKDYQIDKSKYPELDYDKKQLVLPEINITIPKDVLFNISNKFKKVRAVGVMPNSNDRSIIAQGVLNPTVYRVGDRLEGTPFSQASWYFRPMYPQGMEEALKKSVTANEGEILEYRHNYCVRNIDWNNTEAIKEARRAEIQNNSKNPSLSEITINSARQDDSNTFFVDQSIVTLNSPEIEFGYNNTIINEKGTKLRIIGYIPIDASIGDISIQTSSGTAANLGEGFIHNYIGTNNSNNAGRSLVSGLFYSDGLLCKKDGNIKSYTLDDQDFIARYLIYPWQKEGSLNNDINRSGQSALLKTKVISNLKFSKECIRFKENNIDLLDVQIHNDIDSLNLTKFKYNSFVAKTNTSYYGNIDTLLSSKNQYVKAYSTQFVTATNLKSITLNSPIYTVYKAASMSVGDSAYLSEDLKHTTSPVRMKYKSLPHAVLSLNIIDNKQIILPTINSKDWNNDTFIPFWVDKNIIDNLDTDLEKELLSWAKDKGYTKILQVFSEEIDWKIPSKIGDIILQLYTVEDVLYYRFYKKTGSSGNVPQKDWTELTLETINQNGFYFNENIAGEIDVYQIEKLGEDYEIKKTQTSITEILELKYEYQGISQTSIEINDENRAGLFLAELYRDINPNTIFGGSSKEALQQNNWIPIGKPVKINSNGTTVKGTYGDTWYQRYDCLKTMPFSSEDTNQMVEILSFMCETHINIDGRYDRNRGQISNLNVNNNNFNLINKGYTQSDNFFNYRILDDSINENQHFPHTITWSKEKHNSSEIDTFTNITMANTLDLVASKGPITSLQTLNEDIVCFQESGISNILFNSRVQIPVSDNVPIEISNGYKVDGYRYITDMLGCKYKTSITKGQKGLYFADSNTNNIYILGKELIPLTIQQGFETWAKNNISSDFKAFYDNYKQEVHFVTDKEWLTYSEKLNTFTSFYDYIHTKMMFNMNNHLYSGTIQKVGSLDKFKLYEHYVGDYNKLYDIEYPFSVEFICSQEFYKDKIFNTIEYRADTFNTEDTLTNNTFDYIEVKNEYQTFIGKGNSLNIKKKFRIWRAEIGRSNSEGGNKRDRIRNPWVYIKLKMNNPGNTKTELHDILVHYYV